MEQSLQQRKFKLDPRTKLLLISIISTAEFLYNHISFMVVIALIPFVLLMINKQFKTALSFIALFLLAIVAKESQTYMHFNLAVNMMIVLLVGVVLRLFPAFAMGSYIIHSTKASEFISAMGRMHVSKKLTIPVSVVFRFIPTMREESSAIKDAMKMREIQFGTKKFWNNPLSFVEYRVIPLMISVVKIGDELSAAALSRGLDNPVKRSDFTEVGFTMYDVMTLVITISVLVISFF